MSFRLSFLSFSCKRKVHPQRNVAVFGPNRFCVNMALLFSALEAEIILSLGHSWPFFFLLKRLFTITINYSRTERMMHRERYTITVGVNADSAVTPTVIVVIVTVIVVAVVML